MPENAIPFRTEPSEPKLKMTNCIRALVQQELQRANEATMTAKVTLQRVQKVSNNFRSEGPFVGMHEDDKGDCKYSCNCHTSSNCNKNNNEASSNNVAHFQNPILVYKDFCVCMCVCLCLSPFRSLPLPLCVCVLC